MSDIRIKLHARTLNGVQNIWMSLNYDKKPTIEHIMTQLKNNLNCGDDILVNLYLDEYWLPPWENSRLLRENDCIRVEIDDNNEKLKNGITNPKTVLSEIKSSNFYEPMKQQKEQMKLKEKSNLKSTANFNSKESTKFVLNKLNTITQSPSTSSNSSSLSNSSSSTQSSTVSKNSKYKENQEQKNIKTQQKIDNKLSNDLNKSKKKITDFAIHKKFSIANYAHLLNEEKTENENKIYSEQDKSDKKLQASFNNNIEKIAKTINSTARTKWKNSNNSDKQFPLNNSNVKTIPQHIRFESTSDDDNSSSADSDSSSESSSNNERDNKSVTKQAFQNKFINDNSNHNNNISPNTEKSQNNNWKPLTKDKQINMVSYNRSFVIKNPKSVNEFKKVFNKTKKTAPVSNEDYFNYENEQHNKNLIHFDSLETFKGIPNENDNIAFQILEISSTFTPEISNYKTGTVLSYDAKTNEVSLKLNGSSYNEVLNKPNKFTVIDEDENENNENENNEINESIGNNENEDNKIVKIDWSSLINVKIMPKNIQNNITEVDQIIVENEDSDGKIKNYVSENENLPNPELN